MIKEEQGEIKLSFGKEVIQRLREYDIGAAHMGSAAIILLGLFNDELDILDELDGNNRDKGALTLQKQLERKGLLLPGEENNFVLSRRGGELATFIMSQQDQLLEKQIEYVDKETGEVIEVKDWLKEFNHIFPSSNDQHRHLRSDSGTIQRKMTKFQELHPFDKEVILEATRLYISEQEQSPEGHRFTVNSSNFIGRFDKQGREESSDLAALCERVLEERKNPQSKYDSRFLDTA